MGTSTDIDVVFAGDDLVLRLACAAYLARYTAPTPPPDSCRCWSNGSVAAPAAPRPASPATPGKPTCGSPGTGPGPSGY
jgi:hypothetical protein